MHDWIWGARNLGVSLYLGIVVDALGRGRCGGRHAPGVARGAGPTYLGDRGRDE